jgi:hypothetical protein
MDAWEVAARLSILDLIARFNSNGDSGRLDAILALFAPDGVLETFGREYHDHDGLRQQFADAKAKLGAGPAFTHLRHSTSTHQIEFVSMNEARCRCYFTVVTDRGLDHWGVYRDEFRVIDGTWLFSRRRITIDGELFATE